MSDSKLLRGLMGIFSSNKKPHDTQVVVATKPTPMDQPTTTELIEKYGCSEKMATWINGLSLSQTTGWIPVIDGVPLPAEAEIVSATLDDEYLDIDMVDGGCKITRRYIDDHHFGFVTEEMIVDYRTLWSDLVAGMEWWYERYGGAVIVIADLWIELMPNDQGSFSGIDVCKADTYERLFGISTPKEAGCCLFIKALQQYGTLTLRDLIGEIRKHQKFWQGRENALKAGSKGCQFQVGEYVRKVPSDPKMVLSEHDKWECFKVIEVLTQEQQLLFMGMTPQYIPNMILITPDLKKFVGFSGDYVLSPRANPVNKPKNRRNRG